MSEMFKVTDAVLVEHDAANRQLCGGFRILCDRRSLFGCGRHPLALPKARWCKHKHTQRNGNQRLAHDFLLEIPGSILAVYITRCNMQRAGCCGARSL